MRRAILFLGLVAAGVSPPSGTAQTLQMFEHLTGTWEGSGQLFGSEASFTMSWEPVWGGRFFRLRFENRILRGDQFTPLIRAEAFYHVTSDTTAEATWFDSRGMVLPIAATADSGALRSDWGTADTEQGRTIYRIIDAGIAEVEDLVMRDGVYRPFGKAQYKRVD